MEQSEVLAFHAIVTFVKDLNEVFGNRQKTLALFNRLISHITLSDVDAIKRFNSLFTNFCKQNFDAIQNSDYNKMTLKSIDYNDRVKINLHNLFQSADADTSNVMWKHLLTIMGLLDNKSNAKELIRKLNDKKSNISAEMGIDASNPFGSLINEMMGKMTSVLNTDEKDPTVAITKLMSSGVFSEMMGKIDKGIESGEINNVNVLGLVNTITNNPEMNSNPMFSKMQQVLVAQASTLSSIPEEK